MTSDLRQLVIHGAAGAEIREAAIAAGTKTLREDGLAKVLAGVTTPDELFRTVYIDEDRRRRMRQTAQPDPLHALVDASAIELPAADSSADSPADAVADAGFPSLGR
jgi:hypothetical protein